MPTPRRIAGLALLATATAAGSGPAHAPPAGTAVGVRPGAPGAHARHAVRDARRLGAAARGQDTLPSDAVAGLAGTLLGLMRRRPTARGWARRHGAPVHAYGTERPGDGKRRRSALRVAADGWCGRGRTPLPLPGGDTAEVAVRFYPPEPPARARLPAVDPGSRAWREGCRLEAARIRMAGVGDARGARIARQVARRLDDRLGPRSPDLAEAFPLSRLLTEAALWRSDARTVVVGWEGRIGTLGLAAANARASRREGRWAARRRDDLEEIGTLESRAAAWRISDALPVAEAVGLMRAAYRRDWRTDSVDEGLDLDSAFLATLSRWKERADRLGGRDRAAAYLLGDRVVSQVVPHTPAGSRDDSAYLRRLARLDIDFQYSPLGSTHVYTHDWVQKARELAPSGAVADRAFLALLRRGMDTSGTCRGGVAQFATVIREGRGFLDRRGRGSGGPEADDAVLGAVHRLVGDAYADVVTVAAGATGAAMYVDSAAFPVPPAEARRRAVRHYRAALERLDDSDEARRVWSAGWRLARGLPLDRTRFVCIYD